jgi:transposase
LGKFYQSSLIVKERHCAGSGFELSQKKILVIPPAGLTRWDARKKARVVIAVRSGTLSRGEAYDRYLLSEEELSQWGEAFDREGIAGLQIKSRSDRRVRSRTDEIAPAAPVRAQEGPSRASGIEALESELVGSEHHRRTVRGPRKSR